MLFVPFWRKKPWVVLVFFLSFSVVGLLSIVIYLGKAKKCQGTGTKGSCFAVPVHPWEFVLRPEEPLRSSPLCANSSLLRGFKLGQRSGLDLVLAQLSPLSCSPLGFCVPLRVPWPGRHLPSFQTPQDKTPERGNVRPEIFACEKFF